MTRRKAAKFPTAESVSNCALFSDEPAAKRLLQKAEDEVWKARTLTEILERNEQLSDRPVRIYADGVFDLFHHGHAEQLRQVKQMIPNSYLIAGGETAERFGLIGLGFSVCNDADTRKYKCGATVMTEFERWSAVSHCRYVDEVHKSPPFFPTVEFVDSLKVDLVAHDDIPYPSGLDVADCYLPFKESDRFLQTQRAPSISTTELIQRVIVDFEVYRQRQIARMGPIGGL